MIMSTLFLKKVKKFFKKVQKTGKKLKKLKKSRFFDDKTC